MVLMRRKNSAPRYEQEKIFSKHIKAAFIVPDLSANMSAKLSVENHSLLTKMIQAMKLSQGDIAIVKDHSFESVESLFLEAKVDSLIVFGSSSLFNSINLTPKNGVLEKLNILNQDVLFLMTDPLEQLQQNPALKKKVWRELQQVMSALGIAV